jgi:hypothetical protein
VFFRSRDYAGRLRLIHIGSNGYWKGFIMRMTPKQMEKWARIRDVDRTRYIWLYGVFGWGIPVAVFWSLAMAMLRGWEHF